MKFEMDTLHTTAIRIVQLHARGGFSGSVLSSLCIAHFIYILIWILLTVDVENIFICALIYFARLFFMDSFAAG